ncbi:MAG: HutD family protein [Comamonadaceae bacterium]|nr:MAG: HutD family protein [Comamonadaceae bacterium]
MKASPPRSPLRGSLPPEGAAVALGRPGGDWASGWNLVPLAQVPATPWRNGGGSTRELLAWPPSSGSDWRVRLSVAEVAQDGPFSSFPGVQRWFAVLDGAGVQLSLDGAVHGLDRASAPFEFDGGAAVDCALTGGPTQDFNLMVRGGRGSMRRLHGRHTASFSAPVLIAVYAHGTSTEATFGNEAVQIPAQTLAWRTLQQSGSLEVTAQHALWMEVFW